LYAVAAGCWVLVLVLVEGVSVLVAGAGVWVLVVGCWW
jgi:hypothetical protein